LEADQADPKEVAAGLDNLDRSSSAEDIESKEILIAAFIRPQVKPVLKRTELQIRFQLQRAPLQTEQVLGYRLIVPGDARSGCPLGGHDLPVQISDRQECGADRERSPDQG